MPLFRRVSLIGLILMSMIALPGCSSMPSRTTGEFLERQVTVQGVQRRYQVFVPATSAAQGKLPVILFLHGEDRKSVV